MSDIEYPEWQKTFIEALLEANPGKLPAKIFDAEGAIFKRMQALQTSSDGYREWEAIQDALSSLRVLQREKLAYPAWEKS